MPAKKGNIRDKVRKLREKNAAAVGDDGGAPETDLTQSEPALDDGESQDKVDVRDVSEGAHGAAEETAWKSQTDAPAAAVAKLVEDEAALEEHLRSVHASLSVHVYIHVDVRTGLSVQACVLVRIYSYIYIHIHIYIYIHKYACIHMYMYIYIYILINRLIDICI